MFNFKKNKKEEERYIITPKGIAWLMLHKSNIEFSEDQFKELWDNFEDSMYEHGYLYG